MLPPALPPPISTGSFGGAATDRRVALGGDGGGRADACDLGGGALSTSGAAVTWVARSAATVDMVEECDSVARRAGSAEVPRSAEPLAPFSGDLRCCSRKRYSSMDILRETPPGKLLPADGTRDALRSAAAKGRTAGVVEDRFAADITTRCDGIPLDGRETMTGATDATLGALAGAAALNEANSASCMRTSLLLGASAAAGRDRTGAGAGAAAEAVTGLLRAGAGIGGCAAEGPAAETDAAAGAARIDGDGTTFRVADPGRPVEVLAPMALGGGVVGGTGTLLLGRELGLTDMGGATAADCNLADVATGTTPCAAAVAEKEPAAIAAARDLARAASLMAFFLSCSSLSACLTRRASAVILSSCSLAAASRRALATAKASEAALFFSSHVFFSSFFSSFLGFSGKMPASRFFRSISCSQTSWRN